MSYWPFILSSGAVLVAAIVTVGLGHHFNLRLMKSNQQWEKNRHLILSGEKFCDELLGHMSLYQQTDSPNAKTQILLGPVHNSIQLINKFILTNFSHDDTLKRMSKTTNRWITFYPEQKEGLPDHDWAMMTAGTIIKLRFAFSDAQITH